MNEPSAISVLLTSIATIVTSILGWVSSVCNTIVSTPLLYLSLGFFVIGGVCGLIGSLATTLFSH